MNWLGTSCTLIVNVVMYVQLYIFVSLLCVSCLCFLLDPANISVISTYFKYNRISSAIIM